MSMTAPYVLLRSGGEDVQVAATSRNNIASVSATTRPRLASLDVFRGLAIAVCNKIYRDRLVRFFWFTEEEGLGGLVFTSMLELMIFVDEAGSVIPFISHSPWNGLRLADFVMPFFLFIVGASIALVYKNISNQYRATYKIALRSLKLFLLGVFLQGGFFHGINDLTYGVDIKKIRWLGILQRIAIAYFVTGLCEIWFTRKDSDDVTCVLFRSYSIQWFLAICLSVIYLGLLYGLYVSDWQFDVPQSESFLHVSRTTSVAYKVNCSVRGNLGPACNSAGLIDRYILGIRHLYTKPVYRHLKECSNSMNSDVLNNPPTWCYAPFDPEGILSSLMATVTSMIGLHYGHALAVFEEHKERRDHWLLLSCSLLALGLFLMIIGIPVNKSLYTTSYTLITAGSAGLVFVAIYLLVDVYGYRKPTFALEWIGKHSLSIYVLVASNLIFIALQGFYWTSPQNNIVNWVVSLVRNAGSH